MSPLPENVRNALLRAARAPRERYLENDPVKLAHRYEDPGDKEVAALLCALLAFGSVRAFLPKLEALLRVLGPSPRAYALTYRPAQDLEFFRAFRSRVYTGDDLRLLLANLKQVLREHRTLEDAFLSGAVQGTQARLTAFARLFHRADPRSVVGASTYPAGYLHLVCDPARGGASKRWNLFLRWVVRPADGVDLGLWQGVSPGDLVVPLDTHVGRISSLIGLRRRKTNDWKAAEEITSRLREIDPEDPVGFDFALSHIGISEHCRGRWVGEICRRCTIRGICRAARRHLRNGGIHAG